MSRRLFEAVAQGLKNSTLGIDGVAHELMVANVAHELASVYPRFNTDLFKEAARPDPSPPIKLKG